MFASLSTLSLDFYCFIYIPVHAQSLCYIKKLISEPGKVKACFLFVALLNVWTQRPQDLLIIPPFWIYSVWLSYELPFLRRTFFRYFLSSHLKQRRKRFSQTGFVFTPYWALWLWSSKAFKVSLSLSIIPLKLVAWSMYLNLNT